MKFKFGFICLAMLVLFQCKPTSQQATSVNQESIPLIILLEEDVSPADLSAVKSLSVESMKRISRSQNKWMVKMAEEQSVVDEFISTLKNDSRVIEISMMNDENKPTQTTNTKSGKSGPVKN